MSLFEANRSVGQLVGQTKFRLSYRNSKVVKQEFCLSDMIYGIMDYDVLEHLSGKEVNGQSGTDSPSRA